MLSLIITNIVKNYLFISYIEIAFALNFFCSERVCTTRTISHRINSYSAILDQSGLRLAVVWRACQTRREILPYALRMKEDRERCLLNFLANSNGARMRGTQHLPRINSHSAIFDQSNLSLNGAYCARARHVGKFSLAREPFTGDIILRAYKLFTPLYPFFLLFFSFKSPLFSIFLIPICCCIHIQFIFFQRILSFEM